jgi:hypothetical protein
MSRLAALTLLLFAAFALPVSHAQTGIHRCVSNEGQLIFTDRSCSDVQAVDSGPSSSGSDETTPHVVITRTCSRKPEDLLFEVRSALEAGDVNRLAGTYLWTGMGTREAYALMDRLSVFSARPLVDAQLISSAPEFDPSSPMIVPAYDLEPSEPAEADRPMTVPPGLPPPPAPDLIRVDQMHSEKDPATEISYFRIVPAAGCVWIHY